MKASSIWSAVAYLVLFALALPASSPAAWADASVTGLTLVSKVRSGRTTMDYTYRIRVQNGTPALAAAVATVTSSSPSTVILDDTVSLGDLAANTTRTSVDTFVLRQDRRVAFSRANLTWSVTGTALTSVPNVVGLSQAAATTAITGAGLVLGAVTQQLSANVPAGNVISQNPAGGAQANLGSAVNLVVSTGPAQVAVPNVVGLSQAAAATAITNTGLVVGTVTQQSSANVPAGNVISQSPVGGTQANPGSAVNLVVSSGPVQVAVPNVVGLSQAAATTAITNTGLVVGTVTQQPSANVPAGNVISQNPASGAQANVGSAVNLVVSTGPAQVAVPNVVGLTQAAATTAITNAGLVVGTVTQQASANVPAGSVISQNPAGSAQASVGSAVNLVISTGPAQVAVPNVVGLTQAAATTAITNAGLVVGTVTQQASANVPAGNVISQNPAGGAQVNRGSAVNLVVSIGPNSGAGFLPGQPNDNAIAAVVDYGSDEPSRSDAVEQLDENGATVVRTVFSLRLSSVVTVGQVNQQLSAIGGRIIEMTAGFPVVIIRIPDPGTLDAYRALLGEVAASGIGTPTPAVEPDEDLLPPNQSFLGQPPTNLDAIDHLLAIKMPAAWNAAGGSASPTFVVIDSFGVGPPAGTAWNVFVQNAADFSSVRSATNFLATDKKNHGYWVLSSIAASFGGDETDLGRATGLRRQRSNVRVCDRAAFQYDQLLQRCARIVAAEVNLGPVVLVTSLNDKTLDVQTRAVKAQEWIDLIRNALHIEGRYIHVTSAGNVCRQVGPGAACRTNTPNVIDPFNAQYAEMNSRFTLAARVRVNAPDPLSGILVVENRLATLTPNGILKPGCLSSTSYITGHISAVGSEVLMIGARNLPASMGGTSFSTPQVAALAGIVHSLLGPAGNPDNVIETLLSTSVSESICAPAPTPAIDAYAAVLATDSALTSQGAHVRISILDVAGAAPSDAQTNSRFDAADFETFLTQFARFSAPNAAAQPYVESRYDLNGDGFTGGDSVARFDLDVAGAAMPRYSTSVTQVMDGVTVSFNETQVSDLQVLCYYAYSPLFPAAQRGQIADIFERVNFLFGTGLSCARGVDILVESGTAAIGPQGQPFAGFDRASVNNAGQVAFVGFNATAITEGFVADAPNSVTRVSFEGTANRNFAGTAINDASPAEVALRDRLSGSPPTFLVRRWRADGGGQVALVGRSSGTVGGICQGGSRAGEVCTILGPGSPDCPSVPFPGIPPTFFACVAGPAGDFDSATSFVDINDAGVVTFPGLVGDSTQTALFAGTSRADLERLAVFPPFESPLIRPQASERSATGSTAIVYRDNLGRLVVSHYPGGDLEVIASNGFSDIGQAPGISADGRLTAFLATHDGSTGIFVATRTGAVGRLAPVVSIGGDPNTPTGRFDSFLGTSRVAVSNRTLPSGDDSATVVFVATRTYRDPNAQASRTAQGVYRARLVLRADGVTELFEPELVIEVGQTLSNGKAVASFDLWDPQSDSGNYLAFQVVFADNSRAIVRVR